jgi:catechol 2,3-dioxygenase-like lactoylglutathione lyase family enzyme
MAMHEIDVEAALGDYERGRLSRRQFVARLSALMGAAAVSPGFGQERPPATFVATDVNHLALRVKDVGRSAEFYQRHLGLTVTSRSHSSCFLRCSDRDFLALFRGDAPAMDHFCFSVEDYSADEAVKRLEAAGLGPRRQEQRVYFDDPDGLEVQVAARSHGP